MLNFYLPHTFDPKTSMSDVAVSNDKISITKKLEANEPVIFPDLLQVPTYSHVSRNGALLVIANKAQVLPRKGGRSVIFKWYFGRMRDTTPWSGSMKIVITGNPEADTPPKVIRHRTSKNVLSVDPDQMEIDLAQLEYAVQALCTADAWNKASPLPDSPLGNPITSTTGIHTRIREAVAASIDELRTKDEIRDTENKAAQDLMSDLPDGTPLVLRSGVGGNWQLALKKGRMTSSMARHSIIAPSDILRGEELRSAGLSAHDVLPLDMLAAKARKTHPEACKFQAKPYTLTTYNKLHPGQPFHKSFLKGKRTQETVAWIGTSNYSGFHGNFSIATSNVLWREGRYGSDRSNPPYTNKDNKRPVILKESDRYRPGAPSLPRFGRVAGLWCMDKDVVDLIKSYNIGDASFTPVEVIDINGVSMKDEYYHLSMDTPLDAVAQDLCEDMVIKYSGGRTVQPYEIPVYVDTMGDRDFWWDDTMRHGTFFFSDRLYKALKKIKAMPRIAPKPCRGV